MSVVAFSELFRDLFSPIVLYSFQDCMVYIHVAEMTVFVHISGSLHNTLQPQVALKGSLHEQMLILAVHERHQSKSAMFLFILSATCINTEIKILFSLASY